MTFSTISKALKTLERSTDAGASVSTVARKFRRVLNICIKQNRKGGHRYSSSKVNLAVGRRAVVKAAEAYIAERGRNHGR